MFVLSMASPRGALCQNLKVRRNNWNFEATAWRDADQLFRSDPRWLGGDVAYSIDLSQGRVLWLFGDSFIANKPGKTRRQSAFVHNSIAIETGYDPAHASMKFYWPESNGKPSECGSRSSELKCPRPVTRTRPAQ